jgi:hypothetical protein
MHFRNLANLVLLSTALSVQARASASFPKVTAGDFQLIQTTTAAPSRLLANADIPTVPPFVPSADNLIVNTTVPQGEFADLGFIFPSVGDNTDPAVFDGSSINVTVLYTPPGGVETFVFGHVVGSECLIHGADERTYTASILAQKPPSLSASGFAASFRHSSSRVSWIRQFLERTIAALCDLCRAILTEFCRLGIRADGLSSSGKAHSRMRLSIRIRGAAPSHSISRLWSS